MAYSVSLVRRQRLRQMSKHRKLVQETASQLLYLRKVGVIPQIWIVDGDAPEVTKPQLVDSEELKPIDGIRSEEKPVTPRNRSVCTPTLLTSKKGPGVDSSKKESGRATHQQQQQQSGCAKRRDPGRARVELSHGGAGRTMRTDSNGSAHESLVMSRTGDPGLVSSQL